MNKFGSTKTKRKYVRSDVLFKKTKSRFFNDLRELTNKNEINKRVTSTFDDSNLSINSISKFVPNNCSTPKKKILSNKKTKTINDKELTNSKTIKKINVSENESKTSFFINQDETLLISQKIKQIVDLLDEEDVSNETLISKKTINKSQEYSSKETKLTVTNSQLLQKPENPDFYKRVVDQSTQTPLLNVSHVNDKSTQTSILLEETRTNDIASFNSSKLLIPKNQFSAFVKRLIIGISLYGCDFQKISKTLWSPNEQPSPKILYKIFRQYIIKP